MTYVYPILFTNIIKIQHLSLLLCVQNKNHTNCVRILTIYRYAPSEIYRYVFTGQKY